jgi:hypothetical protein
MRPTIALNDARESQPSETSTTERPEIDHQKTRYDVWTAANANPASESSRSAGVRRTVLSGATIAASENAPPRR